MNYVYTAIFHQDSGKIIARIPDLPGCISSGRELTEAIQEITDAASGYLVVAEDEGLTIPAPTPQNQLTVPKGDELSYIRVDTLAYRRSKDTHAVRKNVSLPAWMAKLAEKRGINCSEVLQEGLLKRFSA
jgi:predicted RNase H-like HicB family nuclease